MKTNVLMAIAISVVTSLAVNAQSQKMQPYLGKSPKEVRQVARPEGFTMPMMGLDDKQREEIKKIRTEQVKERTQTRNLLKEKRAKLEVLQIADKPDMKEINKVIDEIAAVQAKEMKAKAADRQKIRSLLTEEQRIYFDAQGANKDKMRADRKVKSRAADSDRFRAPRGDRPERAERPQ
jgi:Spy/CpxP family protein refolding chaperone